MVLDIALGIILAVVILWISISIFKLILIFWEEVIVWVLILAIFTPIIFLFFINLESVKSIFGRFISPLFFLFCIAMVWFELKEKRYFSLVVLLSSSALSLYWFYDSWW